LTAASVNDLVVQVGASLSELLPFEQASLAQAQNLSGLAAGVPLFSSLFNFRHSAPSDDLQVQLGSGIELLNALETTNYPLAVSVDDLGDGFRIDVQVDASQSAERILAYMWSALEGIVDELHNPTGINSNLLLFL